MSEQDVREAAERLTGNIWTTYHGSEFDGYVPTIEAIMVDVRKVVNAYLAEHPADGAEAIDEVFLGLFGFKAGTGYYSRAATPWYIGMIHKDGCYVLIDAEDETVFLANLRTRADARTWFRLAGVNLKE